MCKSCGPRDPDQAKCAALIGPARLVADDCRTAEDPWYRPPHHVASPSPVHVAKSATTAYPQKLHLHAERIHPMCLLDLFLYRPACASIDVGYGWGSHKREVLCLGLFPSEAAAARATSSRTQHTLWLTVADLPRSGARRRELSIAHSSSRTLHRTLATLGGSPSRTRHCALPSLGGALHRALDTLGGSPSITHHRVFAIAQLLRSGACHRAFASSCSPSRIRHTRGSLSRTCHRALV
jgi:hypothetical protein